MTTIKRIGIEGIRSYGPGKEQVSFLPVLLQRRLYVERCVGSNLGVLALGVLAFGRC
jgi:hypothetical protein